MNVRVAECLDMAMAARREAASGLSPAGERFWRRMEERWLHLAETYRETEQLKNAWLDMPTGQAPRHGTNRHPADQVQLDSTLCRSVAPRS